MDRILADRLAIETERDGLQWRRDIIRGRLAIIATKRTADPSEHADLVGRLRETEINLIALNTALRLETVAA